MIRILLPPGRVKRIHVNRQNIARNAKDGDKRPQWIVQTGSGPISCHAVVTYGIVAGSTPEDPQLSCGARVYLTTKDPVAVLFDKEYNLEHLTKRARYLIENER
jgi:hypothetical protein